MVLATGLLDIKGARCGGGEGGVPTAVSTLARHRRPQTGWRARISRVVGGGAARRMDSPVYRDPGSSKRGMVSNI